MLDTIPSGRFVSIETDVFPAWAEQGLLHGLAVDAPFLDIGTPESYARAEAFLAGLD